MLPRVHIALQIIEVELFCDAVDAVLFSVPWGYGYLHIIVIRVNMSSNTLNLRCCPFLCIA